MAFRLPRLLDSIPLVEPKGTPTLSFQQWWNSVLKQIETSIDRIELALAAAGIALDSVGTLPAFSVRTVTVNTGLTSSDYLVLVDATAGAVTVGLPPAPTKEGAAVVIKKIDSSTNSVTVEGNVSDTIDGATSQDLLNQYDAVTVASDGTEWWII